MGVRLLQAAVMSCGLCAQASEVATNSPVTLVTNVVAQRVVYDVVQTLEAVTPAGVSSWLGTQLPPLETLRSNTPQSTMIWTSAVARARAEGIALITNSFAGFVPGSLASVVWAGFDTNGRTTRVWEEAHLPRGWPKVPPVLRWNTNNLMWGRKGMTAISEVAEDMGGFGQRQITALTRRHGYLRGHDMGPSGLQPSRVGRRIWFCTRDNQLIERRVKFLLVRARKNGDPSDYSIVLFDADLPPGIEPMRVVAPETIIRKYLGHGTDNLNHRPLFMSLQNGYVSAGVPGWTVPFRGGDSGNPVMLPLPDELVFYGGLSCSSASAAMQADMDMLSRKAGLDPRKYQMQWVNLDRYPDF